MRPYQVLVPPMSKLPVAKRKKTCLTFSHYLWNTNPFGHFHNRMCFLTSLVLCLYLIWIDQSRGIIQVWLEHMDAFRKNIAIQLVYLCYWPQRWFQRANLWWTNKSANISNDLILTSADSQFLCWAEQFNDIPSVLES